MKKLLCLLLALTMLLCFSACEKIPDPEAPEEPKQVVLLCEPVNQNPFLTDMVRTLEEILNETQAIAEYTVVEGESAEDLEAAALAQIQEGCDLLMMVGQQYAETMSHVAEQYPEGATYVMLDGICDNENVGSYIFKEEELAYLTGIVAASVGTAEEQPRGPFGSIHVHQDQNSFAWRWGYMEGARSVIPELVMDDFIFAYTKSYTDEKVSRELAKDLAERGCTFINSHANAADKGVFKAAKAKGFYVSAAESPLTAQEPLHLLMTQVKHGSVIMRRVLEDFLHDDINLKTTRLGLKEDALNLVFAQEDLNTAPEDVVLTPEILTNVQGAAEKIKSGKLKLSVPQEEDYSF